MMIISMEFIKTMFLAPTTTDEIRIIIEKLLFRLGWHKTKYYQTATLQIYHLIKDMYQMN